MARFFVNASSGIQSSLRFSIIWFRKASTCPELLNIGQDGNTKTGNMYLLRKNRANWLKKVYTCCLQKIWQKIVLLSQLEATPVYRYAALPSYLILLLIQVCPVDFASKLLHWSQNGFRELGDHGGIGIGKNTTYVLRNDKYTVNPHEVKQVAIFYLFIIFQQFCLFIGNIFPVKNQNFYIFWSSPAFSFAD